MKYLKFVTWMAASWVGTTCLIACSPLANKGDIAELAALKQSQFRSSIDATCPLNFRNLNLCGQITPLQNPVPILQNTSFQLKFWRFGDLSRTSVDPGKIPDVWLWMPMREGSHGSKSVVSTLEKDQSGDPYILIRNAYFSMKKGWEIHIAFRDTQRNEIGKVIYYIWLK